MYHHHTVTRITNHYQLILVNPDYLAKDSPCLHVWVCDRLSIWYVLCTHQI